MAYISPYIIMWQAGCRPCLLRRMAQSPTIFDGTVVSGRRHFETRAEVLSGAEAPRR